MPPLPAADPRFLDALVVAAELHAGDVRKGSGVPYVAHLLGVCSLVLEHGGDTDQAIGALLHDAAEDHGGHARLADLRARFGDRVADIVAACSDSLEPEGAPKAPWWPRKVGYLRKVEHEPSDAVVVSAADKLHNARALLADHRVHGDALWSRFDLDAGRAGQLWYQRRLHQVLVSRAAHDEVPGVRPLLDDLGRAVTELWSAVTDEVGADAVQDGWAWALDTERAWRSELATLSPA